MEDVINAPYSAQNYAIKKTLGARAGDLFKLQQEGSWTSSGQIQIPKRALDECVRTTANEILMTRIVTLDLMMVGFGYLTSLFVLIFSAIVGNTYLVFVGVFIFVPTVVHTIDGITRRWKKENLIQKIS